MCEARSDPGAGKSTERPGAGGQVAAHEQASTLVSGVEGTAHQGHARRPHGPGGPGTERAPCPTAHGPGTWARLCRVADDTREQERRRIAPGPQSRQPAGRDLSRLRASAGGRQPPGLSEEGAGEERNEGSVCGEVAAGAEERHFRGDRPREAEAETRREGREEGLVLASTWTAV